VPEVVDERPGPADQRPDLVASVFVGIARGARVWSVGVVGSAGAERLYFPVP
jgi:hypothetical protein